jgi:hypothetical protein
LTHFYPEIKTGQFHKKMERVMVHIFRKCVILTVTIYIFPLVIYAQTAAYETLVPFKVGTFEIDGIPKVALVLRDRLIVDLEAANRTLERSPSYPAIPMPDDMLGLIGRYEYGLKRRLYEIVNDLVLRNRLDGDRSEYI